MASSSPRVDVSLPSKGTRILWYMASLLGWGGSDRSVRACAVQSLDLAQGEATAHARCCLPIKEMRIMHEATRIIRDEHAALSAMLRSILLLLSEHRRKGTLPDFAVLRAMLFYVDEFPEQRHHRKESQLLFPKLRARTPMSRELLDRLDDDHARGERKIRNVEHALLAFEIMGESRREAFETAVERYVDFYLA